MTKLVIEPLAKHHDRTAFSCGEPRLERYLQRQAGQDIKRRTARVFVAVDEHAPGRVVGFYTLSALSVAAKELPPGVARKLPKHPVPAALIGRLAVGRSCRGKGVGRMLVMDAIHRTLVASTEFAVFAMVVDAKNDNARRFYEGLNFKPFPETPTRLFLPLSTLAG
ncbi:MAG: GNAT family N-acetyltransferase [Rhodospirillales bacterium]|nr:GNAT family N-acetyltransferase [Rhodospirillales bacterium]